MGPHLAPSSSAPGRLRCQDAETRLLQPFALKGKRGGQRGRAKAGESWCQAQQGLQLGFSAAPPGSRGLQASGPAKGKVASAGRCQPNSRGSRDTAQPPRRAATTGGAPGSLPRLSRKAAALPPRGRKQPSLNFRNQPGLATRGCPVAHSGSKSKSKEGLSLAGLLGRRCAGRTLRVALQPMQESPGRRWAWLAEGGPAPLRTAAWPALGPDPSPPTPGGSQDLLALRLCSPGTPFCGFPTPSPHLCKARKMTFPQRLDR